LRTIGATTRRGESARIGQRVVVTSQLPTTVASVSSLQLDCVVQMRSVSPWRVGPTELPVRVSTVQVEPAGALHVFVPASTDHSPHDVAPFAPYGPSISLR
jgi:hypothetical protein